MLRVGPAEARLGAHKAGGAIMILRKHITNFLVKVSLLSLCCLTTTALGQASKTHPIESRLQAAPDGLAVEFKVPDGYMRMDFPKYDERRYKGLMMVDPDRPAGMFIILLEEGQTVEGLEAAAESIIKRMFVHSSKPEPAWDSSPLPAHEGDESGKLVMGLSQVQDIQIAVYRRTGGRVPLVYGYFAMRDNTGKMKEPNGKFLDVSGSGAKAFDRFWRSIKEGM